MVLILVFFSFAEARDYQMEHPNSYYQPEHWPQHTLQITKEGSLKDIFDAGFRPYHWPNAQEDVLEFKHSNLTLITSEGNELPIFPMEYSKVKVKPSGLSMLTLIGQSLTTEEAYVEIRKWLPYIGKTEEELSDFLEAVRDDPVTFNDRHFGAVPEGFGGGWVDANKVGYGLRLQKAYNPVVPIRIYFNIGWSRLRTKKEIKTSYKNSVPPPEGYESYIFKEGENFGPDSWTEMAYAKGIPFPEGTGLAGAGGRVIEFGEAQLSPTPKQRPKPNIVEKELPNLEKESSKPRWLMWIVALLVVIGFMLLKGRSK